jgi:hypothetical protein
MSDTRSVFHLHGNQLIDGERSTIIYGKTGCGRNRFDLRAGIYVANVFMTEFQYGHVMLTSRDNAHAVRIYNRL